MSAESRLVDRWRELSSCYHDLAGRLDRALEDGHGVSLNEFETLDRLAAHDGESCRMLDLGGVIHLSQSALSRTVARLERDGLVERAMCAEDRRGVFVRITEQGRARHAEARRTHLAILADCLGARG
ncbi:MarR family winged helix-turn-helix transcriptional regulator [Saccharothrix syringae]|uniref:MarR family transcriptional regulator n=1 Tax=Saccharothrix syringae TaxID=103733 RepID=A0A5Q0GUN3_SACSY|nr:MarR family transcriptional regulator [Saccharothrix syringae]QFZ17816.1 MarR family transcriptional regulator [Saccharothrix syringae]